MTTSDHFVGMRTVGIKQLKAQLSEYVRDVRRGEVFLVTDRDTVVAELRPPGTAGVAKMNSANVSERLAELAQSGEVTPPSAFPGEPWKLSRKVKLPKGISQALIDELREERSS